MKNLGSALFLVSWVAIVTSVDIKNANAEQPNVTATKIKETSEINTVNNLLTINSDPGILILTINREGKITIEPGHKCEEALKVVGFINTDQLPMIPSCETTIRIIAAAHSDGLSKTVSFYYHDLK